MIPLFFLDALCYNSQVEDLMVVNLDQGRVSINRPSSPTPQTSTHHSASQVIQAMHNNVDNPQCPHKTPNGQKSKCFKGGSLFYNAEMKIISHHRLTPYQNMALNTKT